VNVGYGRGYTVREVIEVVQRVSGVAFTVIEAPRRPGDPAMLVAVAEKGRTVLGLEYRYDNLEAIINDAWRWESKFNRKIALKKMMLESVYVDEYDRLWKVRRECC
jgi:UDP-glucose 4-epimerase